MLFKQIFKKFILVIAVLLLIAIGSYLFFEEQFKQFTNIFSSNAVQEISKEKLVIGYALDSKSLEPTLFDGITRSRLVDIYEGLVSTDKNLKIKPALAVSWGLLDPLTWEFKLRPDVKFHNGKNIEIEDVVASIDRARTLKSSQLLNLLNTIDEVKIVDSKTIQIKTVVSDPLLLQKLAITYVVPRDQMNFDKPIGTGPYRMTSKDKNQMILEKFQDYWGKKPTYKMVVLKVIPNKEMRIAALKNGEIDFLADVPETEANSLETQNIQVASIPSLEVNFLMFNMKNKLFSNKTIRQIFLEAIDRKKLSLTLGGFAHPSTQFISNGVFGFNPEIFILSQNSEEAKKKMDILTANVFERLSITFDYPKGLDIIGQFIQNQLKELDIDVKLNPLNPEELEKKITSGTSDFYYLGWKSELGDAADFLESIIHSPNEKGLYGKFNGSHYENTDINKAIENSAKDLNPETRLKSLQEIMKILVEDEIVGIPLFETDTNFAFRNSVQFEPRVDGYIYASEIH